MPLMPKRVKHRKMHRGSRKGTASVGTTLAFGEFGLKALGRGWVKNTQLEACRVAISRFMKQKGKLWIRVFPDKAITKKPIETRMGKGKGDPESWVVVVRPGVILFEIGGMPRTAACEAMRIAAAKLGVPTKFIARH